ncbi:hypothetical protein AVEN_61719-1 [Araneus ventricosus]|uniref:Uncharacterized protein n=1 Tax=Araneus ventricosus TaxID=182803 RepID=A0A4Y2DU54_ARAVE|nr:hypothetical protein AVEN_61719-1 [Araneus ventricosus]
MNGMDFATLSSKLLNTSGFSLVILTPRFDAPRGLFLEGPRKIVSWSDDEDNTSTGTTSQNFCKTQAGGRFTAEVGFNVHKGPKREGSLVESGFEPRSLRREADTLKLGQLPPYKYECNR